MLRTAGIRRDEWQVNVVLLGAGKGNFCLFGLLLNALQSIRLLTQIHTLLFFELVEYPIHDAVVPVVTAQVSVTVGRFNFKNAFPDFENRNIKGAAAQVVNGDFLIFFLV